MSVSNPFRMPCPRLVATALLACVLVVPPSGSAAAAPAGQLRGEIEQVLQRLATALNAKDLDAAMALYALPDSSAAQRKRQEFQGAVGLDSFACETRMGPVEGRGTTAEAAAYTEATYRESGRVQLIASWSTLKFGRFGDLWKITSDQPRDYARTRFTDLAFGIEPDSGTMNGVATLQVGALLPGEDNLVLGLNRGLAVHSVRDAAGHDFPFRRLADAVVLTLPAPLRRGDPLTVRLAYEGTLFNESRARGYSQVSIAPEGSFASWVTSWYPCLPGPGGRSKGRISVTAPAGLTVVASGHPSEKVAEGVRERHVFTVDSPVDFTFAAARYAHREQVVDGVAVGVFFLGGDERKAELYLTRTARVLRFLRDYYGMYPYDGFAIVEIPRSGALGLGGSSEQGMSLFTEGGLPDSTFPLPLVAHEMGHSWWGNHVASSDVMTSEALAQLSAVLAVRELEGEPAMRRFLAYGRADYPQSARMYFTEFAGQAARDLPIGISRPGSENASLLHDLADTKGHIVYDMLRGTLGEEAFRKGLRRAIAGYSAKPLTVRDLQAEWERASGRDLEPFFAQWCRRSGAPEFALRDTVVAEGGRFTVRGDVTQLRDLYDVEAEVVAVLAGGVHTEKVKVAQRETPFAFTLAEAPRAVLFDPDFRILRWTRDVGNAALVKQCRGLGSLGRWSEAIARLDSCLARDPEAPETRLELGILHQRSGQPDLAERAFRSILERDRLHPLMGPAVAASTLHLGEVCDLQGRREEALGWYRRVLETPDDRGSYAQAQAFIQSPYILPAPPPADSLRRYAGTWVIAGAVEVTIQVNDGGVLTVMSPRTGESGLEWVSGARFDILERPGASIEFIPEANGTVERAVFRQGTAERPVARRMP
jgi:tetratricopeptide (TPR) repeat protein